MSEGRQLALLLAGGLALAAVGIVAATAFPEPCEEVEGIGTLDLAFVDATDALATSDEEGAAIEAAGGQLGIGAWRGAVALPVGTRVLGNDFGFFAVTDTDLVALRPGSGIASAPRDVTGYEVVGVGGTSVGLVADDGTIAVLSSDYERERCGHLPVGADIVAIDRGFAVLRGDDAATLHTLSGDDIGSVELGSPVLEGTIVGDDAVVATRMGVVRLAMRDAAPAGVARTDDIVEVLAAGRGHLLVVEGDGPDGRPTVVTDVTLADQGLDETLLEPDGRVVDAVVTPAGTIVLTESGLETDRGGRASLASLAARSLVASEDGQVGLLVDGPDDGGPVLLVWGRDVEG